MNKERIGGLIFLLTGVYGFIFSRDLAIGKWNEPGPGAFPFVLALLLAFSGIVTIARAKAGKEERKESQGKSFLRNLVTPLAIVLLTLGFILSLERVGFVLSTLAYLFILFAFISRYKLPVALGMAAAFGMGSWLFFVKVLGLQLPISFWGI
ncbi:MAG TPA: tripartite tricarboxylate transporter TctB family protein [Thermodesulfobacteriota bacterium]|nr:tripartite tricarboxylate transporter TctB family protein [Thermodesulfobacteriota bacterium]